MLNMVNAKRVINKQSPLKLDPRLTKSAQLFSEYMARTGIFSHTADGRSFVQRCKAQNYAYPLGENIAMGQSTTEEVTRGWFNSPGHMANLMNPKAKYIGFGYAHGKSKGNIPGNYWVQDIG